MTILSDGDVKVPWRNTGEAANLEDEFFVFTPENIAEIISYTGGKNNV